jgi:hypothetical protein
VEEGLANKRKNYINLDRMRPSLEVAIKDPPTLPGVANSTNSPLPRPFLLSFKDALDCFQPAASTRRERSFTIQVRQAVLTRRLLSILGRLGRFS